MPHANPVAIIARVYGQLRSMMWHIGGGNTGHRWRPLGPSHVMKS
jgi:hypothetical protein